MAGAEATRLNEKGDEALSSVLCANGFAGSFFAANGFTATDDDDDVAPKLNIPEPVVPPPEPNGFADAAPDPKVIPVDSPVSAGFSDPFTFISLVGLSSIRIPWSSPFGGVMGRARAEDPNAKGELVTAEGGSLGFTAAPKLKPVCGDEAAPKPGKESLRSAPDGGVAGAAPKAKGLLLPASGPGEAEADDGCAPKGKPAPAPDPKIGLGAIVSTALAVGGVLLGAPKIKGDFGLFSVLT